MDAEGGIKDKDAESLCFDFLAEKLKKAGWAESLIEKFLALAKDNPAFSTAQLNTILSKEKEDDAKHPET